MKLIVTALACLTAFSAYAATPNCPDVHVWYTMTNDSTDPWSVQISRLYENNISFVDENCADVDLSSKIALAPSTTKQVGMKVDKETGFFSTYSFMGVKNTSGLTAQIPRGIAACAFLVAPYGPGQMDRLDWQMNNSNCYSTQYGTEMHFQ